MAQTKKHLLELKRVTAKLKTLKPGYYSPKELMDILKVKKDWPARNKKLLEEHNIFLGKAVPKATRPSKLGLDYFKGLRTEDYTKYYSIMPRVALNLAYLSYNLTAPFQLENEYTTDKKVTREVLDVLEEKFKEVDLIDYLENFRAFCTATEEENYIDSIICIRTNTLLNSLPYLEKNSFPPIALEKIRKAFLDIHGFEASEEQLNACAKVLGFLYGPDSGEHKSASIQSVAGSSKTTTALVLQHLLSDDFNPYITAITNKALVKIEHSMTLSRMLKTFADINIEDTYTVKLEKALAKQDSVPLVIVDESSMVGIDSRRLLELLCSTVIYMGDNMQLAPINDKEPPETIYLHSLREQYRFREAEGGSENSYQVRYTKLNMSRSTQALDELFDECVVGSITASIQNFKGKEGTQSKLTYFDSFKDKEELLRSYSKDTDQILANSELCCLAINSIVNEGLDLKVGSKVVMVNNDYDLKVYNGFQFRILEVFPNSTYSCQSIETGNIYTLREKDIELAYAITTTKAQGSEWKHVLGIDGTSGSLNRRDRYVMITRASHSIKCLVVGEKVDKEVPKFLKDKLRESKEGSRNDTLYSCALSAKKDPSLIQELKEIALELGLDSEEINSTVSSALNSKPSRRASKKGKGLPSTLQELPDNPIKRKERLYTPVFANKKTLKAEQRVLSREQALSFPGAVSIAEELKDSIYIVLDADAKETRDALLPFSKDTEAYIGEETLHLVYQTEKAFPTLIGAVPKLDLLGNTTYRLRYEKENKNPNGLPPTFLTEPLWSSIRKALRIS